ncbi:MAG: chromosome segregation protein SMC [Clostridiaceae bacterium]|nr:chromosome segregation protein SMC [Clostridiaceae bacterium]
MYLKTLEIQGFKSFPDKVRLEFGRGITSIVGPNGSGKSNISDAVRWVLGEQSTKVLRGSKMEDIIFSGTESRKSVGFAEVSITLDNSCRTLPIDYNEVTVTRRFYRSGESEFYINKSSCRLKDIHELFMDTGLGKDGYSIIGQGRIDEILSTRSEDRRQVFEEAAGISKYKFRKQEAEKKLNLTRENLIRLKDIIGELEQQLGPLGEQSEKAKKYLDLMHQLKVLEVNLCIETIAKLKQQLDKIQKDDETISAQLLESERLLDKMEYDLRETFEHIKKQDEEVDRERINLHQIDSAIIRLNNDISMYNKSIENNKLNMRKISIDMEHIKDKIEALNKKLGEKNAFLSQCMELQKELKSSIAELENKNKQMLQAIERESIAIEDLKSEMIEKMNKVSDIKGKKNSLEVLQNNFIERENAIIKDIKNKEEEIQKLSILIQRLQYDHENFMDEINKKRNIYKEKRSIREDEFKQLERLKDQYETLVSLKKEKVSKKAMLIEMEKRYEGYHRSVKQLLLDWQKGRLPGIRLYNVISKLIKVPEQLITAIEVALGSAMQNIVVEREEDAKIAIQFLKQNNLGRATFLPVSSVKGSTLKEDRARLTKCPGYVGIASEIIEFDEKFRDIMNYLLGRVVIVENLDYGIHMAREFGYRFKIVTLDGDVLNPGGSMTGGSNSKSASFLSRDIEINNLGKDIMQIEHAIEEKNNELMEKNKKIQELDKSITELENRLKELESMSITIKSDIKHYNDMCAHFKESIEALKSEKKQLDEQMVHTKQEMDRLLKLIHSISQEIHDMESVIYKKQEEKKAEMASKDSVVKAITDKKIALSSVQKDIHIVSEHIKSIKHEIAEWEKNLLDKGQELEVLKSQNEEMEQGIKDRYKEIHRLEDELKARKAKIEQALANKSESERKVQVYQDNIRDKREEISRLKEEYRRLSNKKIRLEMEMEASVNKLWDEYGLTFTTARQFAADIGNHGLAQKKIKALKEEIKGLGHVNVNAIEEYKSVRERFEFLTAQKKDLEEAEADLVRVINDMQSLMKKQFSQQLAIINKRFNEVFRELFEGGKAEIRLSEPDNILESGIEIEVQPPGKKLQNIMLLSGGEKAFTAIALLFAFFHVRPMPFCILDEIEAALDDANVYKFAQYIKKYSDRTQFILVTHRRGTMEVADVLYGITMQEKGVSKIISLDMEEVAS